MHELASTVREAIAALPASGAIATQARLCAARAAQAQIYMHAAPLLGLAPLEEWARAQAREGDLQWRELLAGSASSVLALHALIAAAADPRTTVGEAERIADAYLSICVVVTLLDGLLDCEADTAAQRLGYISLYETPQQIGEALARAAEDAARKSGRLRNGSHHRMILAAAAAYQASAPGARNELARAVLAQLRDELGPQMLAPLLVMRVWRAGRWAQRERRATRAEAEPALA
jgi:tetraprenyl-beta-curcumene synthase